MHIITISSSFPINRNDPSGVFIYKVLTRIHSKHDVIIPYRGILDEDYFNNGQVHQLKISRYFSNAITKGGGIPELFKTNIILSLVYFLFMFRMLINVLKVHKKKSIIHVHWLLNGFVGFLAKKLKGASYIITLRGSDIKLLNYPFVGVIFKTILLNSEAITVISKTMKISVNNICDYDKHIFFIPNGVDVVTRIDRDAFLDKKLSLVFVGNLTSNKAVHVLLQALANLELDSNFHLSIVGDGPERDTLLLQARSYDIEQNVSFFGRLDPSKAHKIIKTACLLVLPSYSEGTPNVVKEAMACARPVIATNVGGIPELIEHGVNGLLFKPGDHQTLSEHITYLAQNRDVAEQMGKEGRKFIIAKNLTWENTAGQYMKLYKSILARA